MAITFHNIPNNYSPSGNPLSYVFSSDQTGQANFSFKVETLLGGALVSEDQVFPQASNRSQFDVSPIIDILLPKPRITDAISTDLDIIDLISLRVTEVYGDPATDQATLTSSQTYCFKAELDPAEWEDKDFNVSYLNTKWMTDTPDNQFRVISGQDVMCGMLTDANLSLTIEFYDSSSVLLDTYIDTHFYRYWQLNLSSANLNAAYGGVDFNDVSYFTVQIGSSEILIFTYVTDYCFDVHALVWLNKYGTFDQYPIEHNVTSETEIESRSYKTRYGQWNGAKFIYDHTSSGNKDFEKTMQDKGMLVTNYMTDTIQNWFVSSYDSVLYYLHNTTGLLFSLNITNRSYKEKQGRFDDLIMEEMNYQKTNNRNSIKL